METNLGSSFFQSLFKNSNIVGKLNLIHERLPHVEDLLNYLGVDLVTLKHAVRGYLNEIHLSELNSKLSEEEISTLRTFSQLKPSTLKYILPEHSNLILDASILKPSNDPRSVDTWLAEEYSHVMKDVENQNAPYVNTYGIDWDLFKSIIWYMGIDVSDDMIVGYLKPWERTSSIVDSLRPTSPNNDPTSSEPEKVEIIDTSKIVYRYDIPYSDMLPHPTSANRTSYDKDAFKTALNEYAIQRPGASLISFDICSDPKYAASRIMSRWSVILEETKPKQFNRKSTLPENFHLFKKSLLAISKIHNFGDDKYGKFSWVNAEASSCATLESTIGSLTSHFLMIFTNQKRDAETDALHYEHLITRCQMGIYKLYKQLNPDAFIDEHKEDNSTVVKEVIALNHTTYIPRYREQIALTTLLSLNKFDTKLTELTELELRDVMMECLLILLEGHEETSNDIWNKIYILDILFWCTCLNYNKIGSTSGL